MGLGGGKPGKTGWGWREQVAFECALARDDEEDWRSLRERDRALEAPEELWRGGRRREIARLWLEERMARAPAIKLAADSLLQALGVAGQLLGLGGCLLGVGLATAALAYTGSDPINVSAFFAVFVLAQALAAAVTLSAFLLPRRLGEAISFGPLFKVGRLAFDTVFRRLQGLTNRFLSGRNRQDAAELAGLARTRLALHHRLLKWLAFRKLQVAALGFNLGALAALLVSVAFSDRAFGWQTTLPVEPAAAHALVEGFASPWRWALGEGVGYPTVEQVAGSRIRLKEGIQSLETEDLSAWWTFLAFGIVCYGLLPRALFYGLGRWREQRALAAYDFRNAAAERLFSRLAPRGERFSTEVVAQGAEAAAIGATAEPGMAWGEEQRALCLVPAETLEGLDESALRAALGRRWNVSEEQLLIKPLVGNEASGLPEGGDETLQVAFVFESWMPPIKEVERLLRRARERLDRRALIRIVLLGVPEESGEAVSLRPAPRYAETWDAFARRLGDPYLIVDNPS